MFRVFLAQQLMVPGWRSQLCVADPRALRAGVRDKFLLLGELMFWADCQGSPCASSVGVGLVPLRGLTLPREFLPFWHGCQDSLSGSFFL